MKRIKRKIKRALRRMLHVRKRGTAGVSTRAPEYAAKRSAASVPAHTARRRKKRRIRLGKRKAALVPMLAMLVMAVTITGTIALLIRSTDPVHNTFTAGVLLNDPDKFVLLEHKATDDDRDGVYTLGTEEVLANTYIVLPGVDLPKDPFVRTDEPLLLDAYVFVEVVDGTGTNVHFAVDSSKWTELSGVTGPEGGKVYGLTENAGIAAAGSALGPVPILAKNAGGREITVDDAAVTDKAAQFAGDITLYGYMIQALGFADRSAAWNAFIGGTV